MACKRSPVRSRVISTNEEQNEHEVTIQMVGNVFVLFCEIPSV